MDDEIKRWTARRGSARASVDRAVRHARTRTGAVPASFGQRPGLTSRSYTALVRGYGLQQEFITPHSPEQNGMVERVVRTLKDQCVHRHRFETLQHASRVISDWIGFYNNGRPHQSLRMRTPAEAFRSAA
ncbi:integrase core domain-containing protein [Peristeroidobacter agariperforans]|uniref:integrase core domain-containing protein n=1 Tax=Peristeroidobacter agariperforans TaxID=268404 RepID=UPI0018E59A9E|nr:integrase core domain-containing protein [Peristeroidobacter agariperforans]